MAAEKNPNQSTRHLPPNCGPLSDPRRTWAHAMPFSITRELRLRLGGSQWTGGFRADAPGTSGTVSCAAAGPSGAPIRHGTRFDLGLRVEAGAGGARVVTVVPRFVIASNLPFDVVVVQAARGTPVAQSPYAAVADGDQSSEISTDVRGPKITARRDGVPVASGERMPYYWPDADAPSRMSVGFASGTWSPSAAFDPSVPGETVLKIPHKDAADGWYLLRVEVQVHGATLGIHFFQELPLEPPYVGDGL
jgi:hypothetical protein